MGTACICERQLGMKCNFHYQNAIREDNASAERTILTLHRLSKGI